MENSKIDKIAHASGYIDCFFRHIILDNITFTVAGVNFKKENPYMTYVSMDWDSKNKLISENTLFTREESFNMIKQIEFDYATKMNAMIEKDYYKFVDLTFNK